MDERAEDRRAAERAQEDKTSRLKAQRLAKDQEDREATAAARKETAEALKRKRT